MNLLTLPRLRLRLLAPSIALIVAATMIPTGLRHPTLRNIVGAFSTVDFVDNIILYMPLGIAMGGSTLFRTFLLGFSLSTVAELLQLGYVNRVSSPFDVFANTLGAVIGYLAAAYAIRAIGYDPRSVRVHWLFALTAMPVALVGTILLVRNLPGSDFSNWSPAFHLAVGNELTGDRPWAGTVSGFAIYPYAMTPSQINQLAGHAADGGNLDLAGVNLPEPPIVEEKSEQRPPAHSGTGDALLAPPQERRLFDALVNRNQLTLLVIMRTSDIEQTGPARIVTYSKDAFNRNFTLGQIHNTLTFRLRTPASGSNGTDPDLISGPVLSPNRLTFVAAVYDGRVSALYVDGRLVAKADIGARRPRFPRRILSRLPGPLPLREIELGGAQALFSGLFALGLFALAGMPHSPSMRLLLGATAGLTIGGITWAGGVSDPGLGISILLECVAVGLVIASSVETQIAEKA